MSLSHSWIVSLLAGNLNRFSSELIGRHNDVVVNAIQTSLAALKDGSALMANVPYISPIAHLLVQILTTRDVSILVRFCMSFILMEVKQEVKQCNVEWEILMEKVKDVASIIADVCESCKMHGLEDLPSSLHIILETLRRSVSQLIYLFIPGGLFETSDLYGIEGTLRECKKLRGIRKFFLRADMLRRIKQYDSKLSHILQAFQVSSQYLSCAVFIYVPFADHPTAKIGFGFSVCIDCA
jgi:hypothetical protein